MAKSLLAAAILIASLGLAGTHQSGSSAKPDYPFKPVPFTAVHLNDEFWAPRIEINRTASIPSAFEQCELTGRVALVDALRARPRRIDRPPAEGPDRRGLAAAQALYLSRAQPAASAKRRPTAPQSMTFHHAST